MTEPSAPLYILLKSQIQAASDATTLEKDAWLLAILPELWLLYAPQGAISPRLQYLHVFRSAADYWLNSAWRDVDFEEEIQEKLSQKSVQLRAMRDQSTTDIALINTQFRAGLGGAVGQPSILGSLVPVPGSLLDPSLPYYRGDARQYGSNVFSPIPTWFSPATTQPVVYPSVAP